MRRAAVVALAIVAVLLLLLLGLGALARRRYANFLAGYWTGDPGFLKTAQLRDFQLFVAPASAPGEGPEAGGARKGYLLMVDQAGAAVSNQEITLLEEPGPRRWWSGVRAAVRAGKDVYRSGVALGYSSSATPPMPPQMKMAVSILDGTLTLYDDAKVYAFLVKDVAASLVALGEWARN